MKTVADVWHYQVIRALYDYEAKPEHPHELSFSRGDFFHVIGRENDNDWYEACNPSIPNSRGLVPVSFFQVLGRTERDSTDSTGSGKSNRIPDNDSGYSDRSGSSANPTGSEATAKPMRLSKSMGKGLGAMVYGIVQFDFAAERADELDAKAGEAIIVIAQSTSEWFVVKPIGRLGGPGLVPVSFIEIRDMTTGQAIPDAMGAVQRAGVPKVEEWKKMAADYKNSSISLGKFETQGLQSAQQGMDRLSSPNASQPQNGYTNGQVGSPAVCIIPCTKQFQNHEQHQRAPSRGGPQQVLQPRPGPNQNPYSRPSSSQLLAPVSASIPKFCFANDKYWYIIDVIMEDNSHWELSRFYQDFYDFQIALLTEFPEEAGNAGKPRTLPFMPGPVTYVTDAISNGRRQNLDEYIKKLLTMPVLISKSRLVRQLFAPRDGDFEVPRQNQPEDYRISSASHNSSLEFHEDVSRQSSRAELDGNGYQPGLSAPPARSSRPGQLSSNGLSQGGQHSTFGLQPSPLIRQDSSLTQGSGGSFSGTTNGGSAGAMKIKVYFQDDLIAIRVPTDIKYEQLKDKLISRLHVDGDIMVQYKDEPSNTYVELMTNNDLNMAKERNSKLTLYVSLI
jgi:bud emergence protein 1